MAELSRRHALLAGAALVTTEAAAAAPATAFDFRLEAIEGGPLDLGGFRGRPMLVVNTASFCGYTPQYAGLQTLHEKYGPRGLVVLGVPSNDFNQESADARTIKRFCEANYSVDFPMTTPARVTGAQATPLFAFLAAQGGGAPRWNFHKYLVARDGRRVRGFPTQTGPESPALVQAVEAALQASA
ncbi:glutathione peroxidase [Paeniroseomonas aquatica]|uniref:Glutathione peroxidase n=1 Tax=Paeniroseomonas aquatica TaxID=373043 RepID=A0ABT8A5V3_9PROT|nr:glutathione peroxidase [Paeniroseomonas aquatica]MDN3565071.1 glutathione peroxidase [Paeniroseomonas aquatica]